MNRIKSIDGIRALSIIMVLLGHASQTMPKEITSNFFFKLISNSTLGVNIFFVISGYLITKLLIIEYRKSGRINIKYFYIRRLLRIFPIFYIYLFVLIILKETVVSNIFNSYQDLLPAGLYLWNYKHILYDNIIVGNGTWFLGHFWSLSMEEQFYLIWPFVFSCLFFKTSGKKLTRVVITIIVLMPILRVATYFLIPDNYSRGHIVMMLHTGGDAILVGCLGALIESRTHLQERFLPFLQNKFLILFSILFLFVISPLLQSKFEGSYGLPIGMTLNNLCILGLILWCIYIPTKFSKALNNKILVQIGVLSYSLYVWQQLFLTNKYDFWLNKFPQNLFVVFIVGLISYYLIEKPILSFKNKFKNVPEEKEPSGKKVLVNT
jgi:peptidoglycan/LPS O-acetylase OafA/YrhL